jgi:hypothetical protein
VNLDFLFQMMITDNPSDDCIAGLSGNSRLGANDTAWEYRGAGAAGPRREKRDLLTLPHHPKCDPSWPGQ